MVCDHSRQARLLAPSSVEAVRETKSVCWLFRSSLDCLSKSLGLASSTRRPYQPNGHVEQDPAEDPARHADAGELIDPALRRGRANGQGWAE